MARTAPRGCIDLNALDAGVYERLRANLSNSILRRFPQFSNGRLIDGRDLEDIVSDIILAAVEEQRETGHWVSFGILQHRGKQMAINRLKICDRHHRAHEEIAAMQADAYRVGAQRAARLTG